MEKKTFTLLVWNVIPEEAQFYLIPNDVADKYRHFLESAHNLFINSNDMNDGLRFLNHALAEYDEYGEEEFQNFELYNKLFLNYRQSVEKPIITQEGITHVYYAGLIL